MTTLEAWTQLLIKFFCSYSYEYFSIRTVCTIVFFFFSLLRGYGIFFRWSKKQASSSEDSSSTFFILRVTEALQRSGLESCSLIVGVDFSKSNIWKGNMSFGGRCLHDISGTPNPYEQAIGIIGRVLSRFDEDGEIPFYGFGDASTHDRRVFSFYPDQRRCISVSEGLTRYREIVSDLQLSGPTSFAPIIETAVNTVKQSGGYYHILLIIADEQVAGTNNPPSCLSIQESRTIEAIVNASRFPLSIILVGVGDGPWDQKRMELYVNGLPERSFHNFQFVDFTHIMSRDMPESRKEEELALEVLRRIPSQYKAAAKLQMDLITTRMSPPSPPSPRYQICSECFSNITDMVFGCGHEICCGCGENKSVCPICQKTICLKVELERGP